MTDGLEEVGAEDWDARLDALGLSDAYLRRGYLRSGAALTPAEPVLLHLAGPDGDVVFACLLRSDPTDVITPYGYGGPVAVGSAPPVAQFAQAYEDWCARRGVVSSFVLYHPLFANQELALPAFHQQALTGTISWNLDSGDLLAGMHRHHRRMVRRALAAEVEVRIDEAPADLDAFRALYTETMERAGADPFYLFAADYWRVLASEVPLVAVDVWNDEEHLAAMLGLTGAPWLHYHLGASSEAGRGLGANHLGMLALAGWGAEHGYTRLHLGGGVGGRRDSLFLYKERFAPGGERPAAIGKAVHDPERYRALTGQAEITYEGFFPAYRSPH
ncbi:MAG TPA: GNAT family N-acetyltransferase [Solirubrobacteraceae bacterium]|jgi:serine/alanine adding enzyme